MKRKSVFERYTREQLNAFADKYQFSERICHRDTNDIKTIAWLAAGAGIDTLYTAREWNGKNSDSLFEDALAIAVRLKCGYLLSES